METSSETPIHTSAFASYSSRDRDIIDQATNLLRTTGIDLFIDHISLRGGDEWMKKIANAIQTSKRFYLFWSKSANSSRWVKWELKTALQRVKKEGVVDFVVPVLLDQTPLPKNLKKYQYISLTVFGGKGIDVLLGPHNLRAPRTKVFVGREERLNDLHGLLFQEGKAVSLESHLVVAAQGMAGVGKSELADQYARRSLSYYPAGIWWVNGDKDLVESLANLAVELNLQIPPILSKEQKARAVLQKLQSGGRSLLIVDNVTDLGAVVPWLPSAPCSVLITTRLHNIGGPFLSLPVDTLPPEDSIALLSAIAGHERIQQDLENAKNLCKELGYLPLALEMVGHYLNRHHELTISELYTRLQNMTGLSDPSLEITDRRTMIFRAELGVKSSIELNFESIGSHSPAKEVFLTAATFRPMNILEPFLLDVITQACQVSPNDAAEGLLSLEAHSLLKRAGQSVWTMHRLVRRFAVEMRAQYADWRKIERIFIEQSIQQIERLGFFHIFYNFLIKIEEEITGINQWLSDVSKLPLQDRNNLLRNLVANWYTTHPMLDVFASSGNFSNETPQFLELSTMTSNITEFQWNSLFEFSKRHEIKSLKSPDDQLLDNPLLKEVLISDIFTTALEDLSPKMVLETYIKSPIPPKPPRHCIWFPFDFPFPQIDELISLICKKIPPEQLFSLLHKHAEGKNVISKMKSILSMQHCQKELVADYLLNSLNDAENNIAILTIYVIGLLRIEEGADKLVSLAMKWSGTKLSDPLLCAIVFALGEIKQKSSMKFLELIASSMGHWVDQEGREHKESMRASMFAEYVLKEKFSKEE